MYQQQFTKERLEEAAALLREEMDLGLGAPTGEEVRWMTELCLLIDFSDSAVALPHVLSVNELLLEMYISTQISFIFLLLHLFRLLYAVVAYVMDRQCRGLHVLAKCQEVRSFICNTSKGSADCNKTAI